VTGSIVLDTFDAAPAPTVATDLASGAGGAVSRPLTTPPARARVIIGLLHTPHRTRQGMGVQGVRLSHAHGFDISATTYKQDIDQRTRITALTVTSGAGATRAAARVFDWPLTLGFAYAAAADGTASQTTTVHQAYVANAIDTVGGWPTAFRQ